MADLPSANVSIDAAAGAQGTGVNVCFVMAAVPTNADYTPRVYTSAKSLLAQHGYAKGVSYAASHFEKTRLPILFAGVPIDTAGAIQSFDSSGVTGTCRIVASVGASGSLEALDGIVTVKTGGTIGTDQIVLSLSVDGGLTTKTVRLGTAATYTIPNLGVVLSFGAGTLVAEDEFLFRSTAPKWASGAPALVRAALAAQQKLTRTWMIPDDVDTDTEAGYILTEVNAYKTANQRATLARVCAKDRGPLARMSRDVHRMSGAPELTFAEVGATGDTITRATGSWVTDGFVAGDLVTVSGTTSNNFTNALVTTVTAAVLTLDTQDLVAEVTSAAAVSGSPGLTFAEVGATGDTVTRSSGSWIVDGFAVGDTVVFANTASNNVTGPIAALSATVLTFGTTDLVAEVAASGSVTCTKSLTMAAWAASLDAEFASVDAQRRINIGAGMQHETCPITGWAFRRNANWFASWREYQHDVHVATWRKDLGPVGQSGSNLDADGLPVEYDDRVDGGLLAGRFTCMRTWANGPNGAFLALDLTRDEDDTILSRTQNMHVVNVADTVIQRVTENAIGRSGTLNDDGTGTEQFLASIENEVNSALAKELLRAGKEGPRASKATWEASRVDNLSGVPAELNGAADLVINGTLEKINTVIRVR